MRVLRNSYVSLLAWGILLAGTSSLTSCAEDEVINNYGNKEDGAGISFSLSKDNNVWEADSRAAQPKQNFVLRSEDSADTLCVSARTEYSSQDIQSRGTLVTDKTAVTSFEVFSNFYTQSEPNVSSFYFMKNEKVSDGVNPSKAYYWPPADCNLDFIALAPYKEGRIWTSEDAEGKPIAPQLTYTVDDDVTKHEDLMIAKTDKMNLGNSTNASVPLSFNHILASVQFAFGDMPEGIVKSISISGRLSKTGTYTVGGNWINNDEDSVTYTIAADAGVATTPDVNGKEIVNEKIITLPQSFESETLTLTVVFNDASAGQRTLSASIPATTWAKGTTTTYTISISPAYDLQFTTTQASIPMKDCHYDIQMLTVNPIEFGDSWSIESDADWATLRYMTVEGSEEATSDLYWQGYWVVDEKGAKTIESQTGKTSKNILVYIYENTSNEDREATITLYAHKDGNKVAVDTRKIKQYCPLWSTDGKAYERIEESTTTYPWGFDWANTTITYKRKNDGWNWLRWAIWAIWGEKQEYTNLNYSLTIFGGDGSLTGTINLKDLPALNNAAISTTDGLTNTIQLYNSEGITTIMQAASTFESWGMTHESGVQGEELKNIMNFAARMIGRKNKYKRQAEGSTSGTTVYTAVLTEDGIQWYLPASGEIGGLKATACDTEDPSDTPLSGSYWTSTATEYTDENENTVLAAFYYNATDSSTDKKAPRTDEKKIRAARKK